MAYTPHLKSHRAFIEYPETACRPRKNRHIYIIPSTQILSRSQKKTLTPNPDPINPNPKQRLSASQKLEQSNTLPKLLPLTYQPRNPLERDSKVLSAGDTIDRSIDRITSNQGTEDRGGRKTDGPLTTYV